MSSVRDDSDLSTGPRSPQRRASAVLSTAVASLRKLRANASSLVRSWSVGSGWANGQHGVGPLRKLQAIEQPQDQEGLLPALFRENGETIRARVQVFLHFQMIYLNSRRQHPNIRKRSKMRNITHNSTLILRLLLDRNSKPSKSSLYQSTSKSSLYQLFNYNSFRSAGSYQQLFLQ